MDAAASFSGLLLKRLAALEAWSWRESVAETFEALCCVPQGRAGARRPGAGRRASMSQMRGEPVSSGRRRATVPALLQWWVDEQGAAKPAHMSEVRRCMPPGMNGCVELVKKRGQFGLKIQINELKG